MAQGRTGDGETKRRNRLRASESLGFVKNILKQMSFDRTLAITGNNSDFLILVRSLNNGLPVIDKYCLLEYMIRYRPRFTVGYVSCQIWKLIRFRIATRGSPNRHPMVEWTPAVAAITRRHAADKLSLARSRLCNQPADTVVDLMASPPPSWFSDRHPPST